MTNKTVIAIAPRISAIAALNGFLVCVWKRHGFLHHQHLLAETRPAQ